MANPPVKEFSDGTIGIRPFRESDVPNLFEAVRESVSELSIWMAWCSPDYSIKESTEFIRSAPEAWEKGEHYSFVVFDANSGRFLGGTGLNFINPLHNFANLGYWVRTSATRRGVASRAARLAARFGIEGLKFSRLEIVAAVGNAGSQRVAEKAGARREGILRNRLKLHGQCQDAVMFSLTAEDLTIC